MKDLNTTSLNKISRDISGPPGRKSIRDLSAGALYLTGPIQDLLISLDLLGPFTRALYKVSSQDHHVWHLYTRSSARSRPEIPTKDLYERSLLQELLTRSLRKTSIRQGPYEMFQLSTRSLAKTCMRNLFTRALYKISSVSSQELSTKCFHKPQMRRRYATSPDIPGPPRSLHRSSLQDLFTRHLRKISIQELSKISWYSWTAEVSSQQLSTRSLHKTYIWEIFIQELSTRSLHKTSMRDLYTRALYKISSQDYYETSRYKSSLQDLFTGTPYETFLRKISGNPWTA